MTVVTSTKQPTSEQCEEPPMKKQKVEGGGAVATASTDYTELTTEDVKKTAGRPKKRKGTRSKKTPYHDMPQFKDQDYQSILRTFLQRKGVVNPTPVYKTKVDKALDIPGCVFYVTTCNVDGLIGKGRGKTVKMSKKMACLHIIQEQGLVPKEKCVDTMALTLLLTQPKKAEKPTKPIIEYKSYLQGDFKGALERYLKKNDPGNKVVLKFEIVNPGKEQEFVTTCTAVKGSQKGCGSHKAKKKSIQLAYLNCILDMKLISKEQHLEKHPSAVVKGKVEEKMEKMEVETEVAT